MLREYWYVPAFIVALLVIVAARFALRPADVEEVADPGETGSSVLSPGQPVMPPPPPKRQTPQEKALELISSYEQQIEQDPGSEEAPALLFAMGNLYRQKLVDYEKAAQCYMSILTEYPNVKNIGDAYIQLSTCYQRLGKTEELNRIYLEMMRRFPKDSPEYLYAEDQLGL